MQSERVLEARVTTWKDLQIQMHQAQYQPTDRPIEDRVTVTRDGLGVMVGVFDGHRGPWAAEYVSQELPRRMMAHGADDGVVAIWEALDWAMLEDFMRAAKPRSMLDRLKRLTRPHFVQSISRTPYGSENEEPNVETTTRRVMSGSTALIADIETGRPPRIYNAGDSRGFLFDAARNRTLITSDHNANSLSERNRIMSDHPGEPHIFTGSRLFGQQLATRGFGDARYKLPLANHRAYIDIMSRFTPPGSVPMKDMYDTLFHDYRTPPYLTARPDELEGVPDDFELRANEGNMVVLGTDGLWDIATPEEVRDLLLMAIRGGALRRREEPSRIPVRDLD